MNEADSNLQAEILGGVQPPSSALKRVSLSLASAFLPDLGQCVLGRRRKAASLAVAYLVLILRWWTEGAPPKYYDDNLTPHLDSV
jgi:hypothetical protein